MHFFGMWKSDAGSTGPCMTVLANKVFTEPKAFYITVLHPLSMGLVLRTNVVVRALVSIAVLHAEGGGRNKHERAKGTHQFLSKGPWKLPNNILPAKTSHLASSGCTGGWERKSLFWITVYTTKTVGSEKEKKKKNKCHCHNTDSAIQNIINGYFKRGAH